MRITLLSKALLVAGCVAPFASFAQSSGSAAMASQQAMQAYDARLQAIQAALAPIKSETDLNAYLANDRFRTSPLDALSLAARQQFLVSLRFSSKGLASFNYTVLENELTPTQIYKILALFGLQRDIYLFKDSQQVTPLDKLIMSHPSVRGLPSDHQGYECDEAYGHPHTCSRADSEICTSNC
jgi:hypothetical protein